MGTQNAERSVEQGIEFTMKVINDWPFKNDNEYNCKLLADGYIEEFWTNLIYLFNLILSYLLFHFLKSYIETSFEIIKLNF